MDIRAQDRDSYVKTYHSYSKAGVGCFRMFLQSGYLVYTRIRTKSFKPFRRTHCKSTFGLNTAWKIKPRIPLWWGFSFIVSSCQHVFRNTLYVHSGLHFLPLWIGGLLRLDVPTTSGIGFSIYSPCMSYSVGFASSIWYSSKLKCESLIDLHSDYAWLDPTGPSRARPTRLLQQATADGLQVLGFTFLFVVLFVGMRMSMHCHTLGSVVDGSCPGAQASSISSQPALDVEHVFHMYHVWSHRWVHWMYFLLA